MTKTSPVEKLRQGRTKAKPYVITGGMSDDSFHYFRSWILGKGRNLFEVAIKDPNELGPFVDDP